MKTILIAALMLSALAVPAFAAPHKVECLTSDKITNQMAPPELYASFETCLKQEKKDEAVYLSLVAAAYGIFDTSRVPDKTKHDTARNIIIKVTGNQTEEDKKNFGEYLKKAMSTPPQSYPICAKILDLGPPMYEPTYMAGENGPWLKNDELDVAAIWLKAAGMVTHCPMSDLQLNNQTFKP